MSCMHTFSKFVNHQIKHVATRQVDCQPVNWRWPLLSSSGVCAGMYSWKKIIKVMEAD